MLTYHWGTHEPELGNHRLWLTRAVRYTECPKIESQGRAGIRNQTGGFWWRCTFLSGLPQAHSGREWAKVTLWGTYAKSPWVSQHTDSGYHLRTLATVSSIGRSLWWQSSWMSFHSWSRKILFSSRHPCLLWHGQTQHACHPACEERWATRSHNYLPKIATLRRTPEYPAPQSEAW
jgi:hypothetical protein